MGAVYLKKKIIFICCCLVLMLTQVVCASSAEKIQYKLNGFSYTVIEKTDNQPSGIRIELSLNKAMHAFAANLTQENALIVNLDSTKMKRFKSNVILEQGNVKKIEFVKTGSTTVQAKIKLRGPIDESRYRVYTLPADKKTKKSFRIVIDILDSSMYNFDIKGLKGKNIVIDAGHGGTDSGAIGPNGVQEKDVNLAVALKVQDILHNIGANVVMSRVDDRDVYGTMATDRQELQARVDVGERSPADVFVSIHANAFSNPSAHGTATYYYEKSERDAILAQSLQDGMVDFGGLFDRGIHEANFYVVKRSSVPAALVETAFISNKEEEELLNSSAFQQKLAEGICKGLSDYFNQLRK